MRVSVLRFTVLATALLVLGSATGTARSHAASASAVVRVNQVGYPTGAAKRAYLMSSVAETGATFAVKSGTTTVYSAPIGARLGSWSRTYGNVYALDFPTTTAGTYTIAVTGPAAATSPAFTIGTGSAVYGGALANALAFYQAERDGPSFIASGIRTAAVLDANLPPETKIQIAPDLFGGLDRAAGRPHHR